MRRGRSYLLSLGSNIEPERWIPCALALLRRRFAVEAVSARYDVGAVGAPDHPRFLNLALRLRTDLPPRALKAACRHIEALCERVRTGDPLTPRTLDVDVVYSATEDAILDADLLQQAYVLVPCAEAWPDLRPGALPRTLAAEAAARFPTWARGRRAEVV